MTQHPKSYLGWPVTLREPFQTPMPHITLKYLGDSPFSVDDLVVRMVGLDRRFRCSPDRILDWSPGIFDENAHVFIFENYDRRLHKLRDAADDLRPDTRSWRPHLTLSKDEWDRVCGGHLSPCEVIRRCGPLTLFTDKKAVYTFD